MWSSDNDLLNWSDSTQSLYTQSNPLSLQDHIQEVLNKWQSIDDEIWAKIIVLERNRRVAKAYARAHVLTVNGSDDGLIFRLVVLSKYEEDYHCFLRLTYFIKQTDVCQIS